MAGTKEGMWAAAVMAVVGLEVGLAVALAGLEVAVWVVAQQVARQVARAVARAVVQMKGKYRYPRRKRAPPCLAACSRRTKCADKRSADPVVLESKYKPFHTALP